MNITMYYSEERETWNVNLDGEWYYEGTYEECEAVLERCYACEAEEEEARCAGYEEY